MGLPAQRASTPNKPQVNDILIQGYLLSVAESSAVERMAIASAPVSRTEGGGGRLPNDGSGPGAWT